MAEAPDGALVATAGWCRVPDDAAVARLRKVFVAPDRAGQGLGRRMVEAAEGAARAAGFHRFRVRANANAEAFYARLGYRPVRREDMPTAGGIALPTVIMVKGLTPASIRRTDLASKRAAAHGGTGIGVPAAGAERQRKAALRRLASWMTGPIPRYGSVLSLDPIDRKDAPT